MLQVSYKKLAAVALTLGLSQAGGAGAIFTVTDSSKDGSFTGSDITYGNGDGAAFVTPLLFTADLGNTKPASSQVVGAGIDYLYSFSGGGSSPVKLQYTFTSTRKVTDPFPNVTGLRFMLDVIAAGSSTFPPTDKASQSWPAAVAGDPDKRQIQDLNAGALNSLLVSNNGVTDNAITPSCVAAGAPRTSGWSGIVRRWLPDRRGPSTSQLVDNPALVSGGRYLRADSVDVPGNTLFVGNPTVVPEPSRYAMLLAGIAMLAAVGGRRLRRLG